MMEVRRGAAARSSNLLRTFGYLVVPGFITKLLPFLFQFWTIRRLKPDDFANEATKYQVLLAALYTIFREAFRRACMRIDIQRLEPTGETSAIIFKVASRSTFPLGLAITFLATMIALIYGNGGIYSPYGKAVLIFGISGILETLAEPLHIVTQCMLHLKIRCFVESSSAVARYIAMLILIIKYADMDKAIVFSWAAVAYSACFFAGYWCAFHFNKILKASDVLLLYLRSFKLEGQEYQLWRTCFWDGIEIVKKLLVQEAPNLVLMSMSSASSLAVYRFIDNLGGLVVRMLFLPLEESSYQTFASQVRLSDNASHHEILSRLRESLTQAMKLVTIIGLVVVSFGPSYSYCAIRILHGRNWSDGEAPNILRWYCFYIFILAVNGTSEAFHHAIASRHQLKAASKSLAWQSFCLMLPNLYLVRVTGAVGIIAANSLNMMSRIYSSLVFIRDYFQGGFDFRRCIPSEWHSLLLCGGFTLLSENWFLDRENFWPTLPPHAFVGALCFLYSVVYHVGKPFIGKLFGPRVHID